MSIKFVGVVVLNHIRQKMNADRNPYADLEQWMLQFCCQIFSRVTVGDTVIWNLEYSKHKKRLGQGQVVQNGQERQLR